MGQHTVSLKEELEKRGKLVRAYLFQPRFRSHFKPEHLNRAVYSYFKNGGKFLRPSVLLFSCGAVGGDERIALPAACGLEVYHTWTLVHDDILDMDAKRRGGMSVHEEFRRKAKKEFSCRDNLAGHYGVSVGILTGDIQHAWAIGLFSELSSKYRVHEKLTLKLITELETNVLGKLIEGELLDIQYARRPLESLSETMITGMLWKKTGALYAFAGQAGAMLGLNTCEQNHPQVKALSDFMSNCGMAFQIHDDILGITGNEKKLGKPVGSDIKEGKRTVILYHAWKNAGAKEKRRLSGILGRRESTSGDIREAVGIIAGLGGVERARRLGSHYISRARKSLSLVPASDYRELLSALADYLIEREN